MNFKVLTDPQRYQKFVENASNSMLYHTNNYLSFASDLLGCQVEILAWEVNNEIVAACPWLFKEGAFGKVYNSLAYYGANGGVLYTEVESVGPFIAEMEAYLTQVSTVHTQISNPFDEHLLVKSDFTQNRVAQITELPSQSEDSVVMEIFHSKTRNMVRKGLKEDVGVQVATNLEFLAETHLQNMEAVNVNPKGDEFFKLLPKYFTQGQDYQVFEALIENGKAAALLVFYHLNMVEYYMPAIHIDYRNKQAMSALILRVMQDSIDKGYTIWNWGGTPISNENLYRFKSRFGAIDKLYTIQGKVNDKSIFSHSIQKITDSYPGMFVVPFDMLNP
jgi:hypothetical protein